MANSRDDAERRAIQAIRDADPARILTSQDGYALTVGRLCELALSTSAPQGLAKYIGNRQPENTSPHSEKPAIPERVLEAVASACTSAQCGDLAGWEIALIGKRIDELGANPPSVGPNEDGGANG